MNKYAFSDSVTMLRRVLTHMLRNPVVTLLSILATPIILLLMMYNLFGGMTQLNAGASNAYINYLTPGMIMITAIYGTGMAAIRVNSDMTQGIVARFRSMSISRGAVLYGHVIGSVIGTLISIGVIVGLAYLTGFRPTTSTVECLAALGLIVLYVFAVMWVSIAVGVASKTPGGVNSMLYLFYIIPFFSTAFTPTTSMTPVVAWIAQNQPFTPIIEALRGLLLGTPIGNQGLIAVGWCVVLILVSYVWSRASYNRNANTAAV